VEAFAPIAILLVFAVCLCLGIYLATNLFGPRNPLPGKLGIYECGTKPEGNAHAPFKTQFYLVAVLFLLFDVEAVFFFPWALVYRESLRTSGGTLLAAMVAYLFFMVIGLVYIFKKDVIRLN
jgi:NADH-quinone oxidoreductase subunit A